MIPATVQESRLILFDREAIERTIPHRDPFLLIDAIVAFEAGVACTSLHRVDPGDPILKGHFPGSPVLPGVLLVEIMAQTACFLAARTAGGMGPDQHPALGQINKCSFLQKVRPGDVIETSATLARSFGSLSIYVCHSAVHDRKVAKAELVVALG